MKMDTFRLIGKVNHDNKNYLLFSNDNCFRFPIRVLDNGSIIYPTIEEFSFFYKNFMLPQNNFYVFNNNKSQRDFKPGQVVHFEPKVINKKVLIPVAAALLALGITGYTIHTFNTPYDPTPVAVSESYQVTTNVENEQNDISDEAFCQSKGYNVEVLPGGLLKLNGDSDEVIAGSIHEIEDRLGPAVNYSDVIETIRQNNNIKDEYKEILIEGINNLEKNGLDLDLRILNYNMNRLNIQEMSRSEIQETTGYDNVVAFYRMQDGTAVISNDADPEVAAKKQVSILHEILGHGMTEATFPDGSMRVSKIFTMNVVGEGNQRTLAPNMVGMGIGEGIADTITYYALDKNYDVTYDSEVFQLEFIRNLLDIDFSETIDNGATGIVNTMGYFGFEKPQIYLDNMDAETMASHANVDHYEGVTVSQNIQNLVSEYVNIQLAKGVPLDEIRAKVQDTFNASSFDEVVVNSHLRMDVCNVDELEQTVLNSIDSLQQDPNSSLEVEDSEFEH